MKTQKQAVVIRNDRHHLRTEEDTLTDSCEDELFQVHSQNNSPKKGRLMVARMQENMSVNNLSTGEYAAAGSQMSHRG
jgi:hypothetical protein